MINVDEQELLKRSAEVEKKGEIYRHYTFALEIYRSKYDRYLAQVKMEIKKNLVGEKI